MDFWNWWSRDRDLDRLLRTSREEPGDDFVHQLNERIDRTRRRRFAVPRLVLAPALAIAAIAVFASAGGYAIANSTDSGTVAHCEQGVNTPHLRWHYSGQKDGKFTSGSWSATGTPECPSGQITMTQGPMEGDLQLGPNDILRGRLQLQRLGRPSGTDRDPLQPSDPVLLALRLGSRQRLLHPPSAAGDGDHLIEQHGLVPDW